MSCKAIVEIEFTCGESQARRILEKVLENLLSGDIKDFLIREISDDETKKNELNEEEENWAIQELMASEHFNCNCTN